MSANPFLVQPINVQNAEAAMGLAIAGLTIFPCGYDRLPRVKWGTESTSDAAIVAAIFLRDDRIPAINLGESGLVVIDTDRHGDGRDGEENFLKLVEANGGLPSGVPMSKTPSGGLHRYFRAPPGLAVRNSASKIAPAVDVRAVGGMALAPGATLPDGRGYRPVDGTPDLAVAYASGTIPELPAWLVALAGARPQRQKQDVHLPASTGAPATDRERDYAAQTLEAIAAELGETGAGQRNDALNRAAYRTGRLVSRGWIDEETVRCALEGACLQNGLLAEGEAAVSATITSGLNAGLKLPHEDLIDPAIFASPASIPSPFAPSPTIIKPTPFTWRDPATIPTRQWLYGRHLIRKFVSATIAAPGVGKSTLGLAEDVAMASGRALLGHGVATPLRVWSWNGEDPLEELQRRVAAICLHYGVIPEEIGDRLFLDSGREKEIVIACAERNGFTIAMPVVSAVKQAIADFRIDVFRVDPFVSCHRVTENDNIAIDAVVKQWAKIADETDCAIELTHHSRKTGGAEVSAEDARGASALLGTVRSARVLNVMTDDEAGRAGVENRRTYFRLDNGKSNLAPPPDKGEWFRIVSQGLGNGAGGPEDVVGVATRWTWPDALCGLGIDELHKAQEALREGEHAESIQAMNWAGLAIGRALGIDVLSGSGRERVKQLIKVGIADQALRVESRHNSRTGREQRLIVASDRTWLPHPAVPHPFVHTTPHTP